MWSLSVEEQFYIGWPIVLMIILRLRCSWCWALAVAALVVLSRYAAVHLVGLKADSVYTLLRYDEMLLGCALAQSRFRFPAWVGCIALATLLVLATFQGVRLSGNHAGYILISCITTMVVGSAAQLRWLFANAPLRYMGRISYSVYLWHFPIWVITANPWLTLALSLATAELSWHFVERPIMNGRHLRWLSPPERGAPNAVTAFPPPATTENKSLRRSLTHQAGRHAIEASGRPVMGCRAVDIFGTTPFSTWHIRFKAAATSPTVNILSARVCCNAALRRDIASEPRTFVASDCAL